MSPSHRLHQVGTALDIGAINDSLTGAAEALERLSKAHLSGSISEQKRAAAEVRKYAERISSIAGALDARLSAHLQRKPRAA